MRIKAKRMKIATCMIKIRGTRWRGGGGGEGGVGEFLQAQDNNKCYELERQSCCNTNENDDFGGGEGKNSCKDKMKTNMTNKKGEKAKNSFKQKKNMDMINNKGGAIATKMKTNKMNRRQGRDMNSYKQKTKTKTTSRKGRLLQQKQKTNMGNRKGE